MILKLEDLLCGRKHSANDNSESLCIISTVCIIIPLKQFLSLQQSSLGNFSWVWGGSTVPNLLEPLSCRWNKDHRIISYGSGRFNSFEPVQTSDSSNSPLPLLEVSLEAASTSSSGSRMEVVSKVPNDHYACQTCPTLSKHFQWLPSDFHHWKWYNSSKPVRNIVQHPEPVLGWTWHEFKVEFNPTEPLRTTDQTTELQRKEGS